MDMIRCKHCRHWLSWWGYHKWWCRWRPINMGDPYWETHHDWDR